MNHLIQLNHSKDVNIRHANKATFELDETHRSTMLRSLEKSSGL